MLSLNTFSPPNLHPWLLSPLFAQPALGPEKMCFLRFHLLSLVHLLVPVLFIFFPHRPFIELKNNVVNCEIYISLQIFAILSGFCPTVNPLAKSDVTGDICFYIIEISRGPRPLHNNAPLDITFHRNNLLSLSYQSSLFLNRFQEEYKNNLIFWRWQGCAHFQQMLVQCLKWLHYRKAFMSRYIHL